MNDQVEEIKQKNNIVEVVGQYVELKKAGRHHKGCCPFHSEKTPSFTVSEELGFYKCFGCGVGGDVIKFLMEIEGIEFLDALERLADRVGIKLEKRKRDNTEKEKMYEVMELAARYYHWLLVSGKSAEKVRSYVKERKINERLVDNFNLGYSLDSWDELIGYLHKKKGYSLELLEKVGLVVRKSAGGYYDKFRGRLMFPLQDSSGKVVGFTGRVLPFLSKEGEPKYLNSPETEIYHKGKMLYGFYQAKQAIREKKKVVLVEGQMDMISSFGAGVSESVAVGGTGITENQIEMLARLSSQILVSLDADDAGYAALKRTIDIAERRGMSIKVVQIDGGKDPDEISRNSPGKWKEMVDNAVDVYDFVINRAVKNIGVSVPENVKKILHEVVPFIAKIDNSVIREVWAKRLSQKIDVSISSVIDEINKSRTGKVVSKPVATEEKKKTNTRVEKLMRALIISLFESPETTKMLSGWFREFDSAGGTWKIFKSALQSSSDTSVGNFVKALSPELREEASEILLSGEESEKEPKRIKELAVSLIKELIKEKKAVLVEKMAKNESAEGGKDEESLFLELAELNKRENWANSLDLG